MSYNCRSFANKTQARIYSSINIHFILINLHSVTLFLNYCYSHTHTHTHTRIWNHVHGDGDGGKNICEIMTATQTLETLCSMAFLLTGKSWYTSSWNTISDHITVCQCFVKAWIRPISLYFKGEWCDHYQTFNTSVKGKNLYIRAWNQRNGLASFPFCREAPAWSMIHTKKGISRREEKYSTHRNVGEVLTPTGVFINHKPKDWQYSGQKKKDKTNNT